MSGVAAGLKTGKRHGEYTNRAKPRQPDRAYQASRPGDLRKVYAGAGFGSMPVRAADFTIRPRGQSAPRRRAILPLGFMPEWQSTYNAVRCEVATKARVIRTLRLLGFELVREHKHIAMIRRNSDGTTTPLTIPNHQKLKGSTLRGICTQAEYRGMTFFRPFTGLKRHFEKYAR